MNPGDTTAINIELKSDYALSEEGKDKFLFMCLAAPDVITSHVVEFWKQQHNQHNVELHRLTCLYNDSPILEQAQVYEKPSKAMPPAVSKSNLNWLFENIYIMLFGWFLYLYIYIYICILIYIYKYICLYIYM